MNKIFFCPPTGEILEAPDLFEIQQVIFNSNPDFWKQGSGDAGLHYDGSGDQLIFQFVESRGFCVTHEPSTDELPKVLIEEGESEERERVLLSGNPMEVPRCYFVSPGRAWDAAVTFMKDGVPLAGATWRVFDPKL